MDLQNPLAENGLLIFTIAGSLVLLLLALERRFPLRKPKRALGRRLIVNGLMSLMTYVSAAAVVRPVAFSVLDWSSENSVGVTHLISGPAWVHLTVGFFLLDLTFYYWHRLNHRLPFLWRFHNAHHVDPDLDVSTGFRFHFGEVMLSTLFRVAQVVVIGASITTYLVYELVFQVGTFFHHSNLRLPKLFESKMVSVFVTPRMHGIHHSKFHEETDSNYSVVFSFWDRIHRTFRWDVPQEGIDIGVPAYTDPEDNRVKDLVLMPFRKQRNYWLGMEKRK